MQEKVPDDLSKPTDLRADYEDYDDAPEFAIHAVTSFSWVGLSCTCVSIIFVGLCVYLRVSPLTILALGLGSLFAFLGLALSWEGYKTIQNPIKMPEKHIVLFIRVSCLFSVFIAFLYLLAFIGGMCIFGLVM